MKPAQPFAFKAPISRQIWESKYQWKENLQPREQNVADTWKRLARTLAAQENDRREYFEERFYALLENFRFLPGGRIWAGAGTHHKVTLFNCFVMGLIDDSMDGIFDGLKQGAMTMHQGGGVGYDFSTLRPKGSIAQATGTIASGPVSFMRIWNAMCATILSTGARRGAMMATLRCDHPDIEEFITAKAKAGELNHFNMSVLVTDAFMAAVESDGDWDLVFPLRNEPAGSAKLTLRPWSGSPDPVTCKVHRTVRARSLWRRIMENTYSHAEPGVIFIDRINRENNLHYCETLSATNPCGEIPLPPFGACNLGSINLTQFVTKPFTENATWDLEAIKAITTLAVRFLDNVIDASQFPLPEQRERERANRRIGLGVTGLGDALILLGLHYGSDEGRSAAAKVMETICHEAYRASANLAREKGAFPLFDRDRYMAGPFIQRLPHDIQEQIRSHGMRNSHVLAIAPTGTISLLANNVSSGIEPVFDFSYRRNILDTDGTYREHEVVDYAAQAWRDTQGDRPFAPAFVTALQLEPLDHLKMQAALQPFIDNSISKTINIPADFPFERFIDVYRDAYRMGNKSCTTFRPNPITGSILVSDTAPVAAESHCCSLEREAD